MERLKRAIQEVGQLQPIRVRRVGEQWMIVDGQRRWLSLCSLAKQFPDDVRFQEIKMYTGDELDEATSTRRIVQVLSNVSADLTPTEKAEVLRELERESPDLGAEAITARLGLARGQVEFLRQLAAAPDFIKEFGRGSEGKQALPLWNLVTLIRFHRRLKKWDDEQFKETEGAHQRLAEREARRLADRAQEEGWGKRELQGEAERVFERISGSGSKTKEKDVITPIRKALSHLESLSNEDRREVVDLLRAVLERIERRRTNTARSSSDVIRPSGIRTPEARCQMSRVRVGFRSQPPVATSAVRDRRFTASTRVER